MANCAKVWLLKPVRFSQSVLLSKECKECADTDFFLLTKFWFEVCESLFESCLKYELQATRYLRCWIIQKSIFFYNADVRKMWIRSLRSLRSFSKISFKKWSRLKNQYQQVRPRLLGLISRTLHISMSPSFSSSSVSVLISSSL